MREYPGRGYAQESMTYIQWYIGTCNYCIIASKFATAMDSYLCDCCGIVTFAVELYLRFAMELLVIFDASFQHLYHRFATAMKLYRRDCCGIVTFAVELYLRFAMELLVIFRASFQEDSPLEYPVFASTI